MFDQLSPPGALAKTLFLNKIPVPSVGDTVQPSAGRPAGGGVGHGLPGLRPSENCHLAETKA